MVFRLANLIAFFTLIVAVVILYSDVGVVTISTPDSYYFLSYDIIEGFTPAAPGVSSIIEAEWWAIRGMYAIMLVLLAGVIFLGKKPALQRRFWEAVLAVQIILSALVVIMLYHTASMVGGKVKFDLGIILMVIMIVITVLGWRSTLHYLMMMERRKRRRR